MSANRTGWSLKKLPTISVLPPHKVGAEWSRRGGFSITWRHLGRRGTDSGGRFALGREPRELERRERAEQLRMGAPHVQLGVLKQLVLVLTPDDIATPAADHSGDIECPLGHWTAPAGGFSLQASPFVASA
jgi:hypothetical protein